MPRENPVSVHATQQSYREHTLSYLGGCDSAGYLSTICTHDSAVGLDHSHGTAQPVVLSQGS